MSPLYDPKDYVPSEKTFKQKKPGVYKFRVDSAKQEEGNGTIELVLSVNDGESEFNVRDWIHMTKAALWKMDQFMNCLGLDFNKPPDDVEQFINYEGTAKFVLGQAKEGKRYLEVKWYEEMEGDKQPISENEAFKSPETVDEIPF